MKPTLRLRRKVHVERWNIVAHVGLAVRRAWEQSVLRLACDAGDIDGPRLAEHLLDGRTPIAQRLLQSCVARGLLTAEANGVFRPTTDGHRAAETGEVFVAEEGTWTLSWCNDPLLGTHVAAIDAIDDARTSDEVLARRNRRDRPRELVALPAHLKTLDGARHEVISGSHPRMQFEKLLGVVERVDDQSDLVLELELQQDLARGRLRGQLGGIPVEVSLPHVELSYETAWTAILAAAGLTERWASDREALLVTFQELDDQQRGTFQTTVVAAQPRIEAYGAFDDVRVERVRIAPLTEQDAQAWAVWRLKRDVQGIATTDRYERWTSLAAEPFEPRPTVPSRGELAASLRGDARPPPLYWSLQVAEDWHL